MPTEWLAPLFVTGDPSLRINYPSVQHPNTVVTSTSIGDLKWLSLGLALEPNAALEEVIVCYQVSNARSFIKQVRIEEMSTPDQALVLHDDPAALDSTSAVCYTSNVGGVVPTAAVSLALRLYFGDINDVISLGAVGVKIRPSPPCCVNVRDFGAVGQVLSTNGSIQAGSKVLTVDSVNGWSVGAGIGIADAAVGLAPPDAAALVTRIVCIDPIKSALHLKDSAANTVARVTVTSDDSLPIQDAIDSLGKNGGTVCLPAGTYMIGTTGATTNQPMVLGSNLRVVGAGRGATILQLCQEANVLYLADAANPLSGLRMAGPIFVNAANDWWFPTPNQNDSNIEIAGITFDGDKNRQTLVYEPEYRPNPTQMPNPTTSHIEWAGLVGAGTLPQGTYDVWIRFQDLLGNEGMGVNYGGYPIGLGNNTIAITLPPVYPEGSVAVVPYIRRADPPASPNPVNEVGTPPNPRYERLDPISLSNIQPWDGNPDPRHWPTIKIIAHTLYPQGPVNTQGNYRVPGILTYWGDTGASFFGYFFNAENLYVHDIEVRNFAGDGFGLRTVKYSRFDRIHSHHNGRDGVGIVYSQMEEVDFNDCVFESNWSAGVDMEPIECRSLRWNRCSFLNNGFGVAIDPGPLGCQDLEFNTCLFDGNMGQLVATGGEHMNIVNLKIKDCRFRNNDGACVQLGFAGNTEDITGEITGCEFDQANGRTPAFAPRYEMFATDGSAIRLGGLKTIFRMTNNHFKPWAAVQPGTDGVVRDFVSSAYMIDISQTAGGHTIQNNHFESNPQDTRPDIKLGDGWSTNVKNMHFMFSDPDNLRSCKISGNIGDGRIWSGENACGLDLAENGSITSIASGAMSAPVVFVDSLPGSYSPPIGNYLVTAALNWKAGAWWVTGATPTGFTINWETAPGASLTPQLNWSAKFAP